MNVSGYRLPVAGYNQKPGTRMPRPLQPVTWNPTAAPRVTGNWQPATQRLRALQPATAPYIIYRHQPSADPAIIINTSQSIFLIILQKNRAFLG